MLDPSRPTHPHSPISLTGVLVPGIPILKDEGANHGFPHGAMPRYDPEQTELAQGRTDTFFNQHVRG